MDELTTEHFEIAKTNGISRKNVLQRYWDYGWEIERAITEPLNQLKDSSWRQWKEVCSENGVYHTLFCNRINKGMTPEEAATTPVKKRGPYRKTIRKSGKYAKLSNT